MTARGRCCYYYLEHCIKTNHFAIKGVIKRAKYENVFGLSRLLKHVDLFLAPRKMGRSPRGHSLIWAIEVCAAQGMVFQPFWS